MTRITYRGECSRSRVSSAICDISKLWAFVAYQCNGLPCCGGEFFFGQGAGSQRRTNDGNVNGLLLLVAAPHAKAGTVIGRHKAAENQIYNQKNRGERCDFGYVLQKIRS